MKNTLHLILKKKWFDMILSGEKKEEYRDIKPHYESRFYGKEKFDTVTFTHGYAKNSRRFEIECKGITISTGFENWGAEKGKEYFVIKLGKIIKIINH